MCILSPSLKGLQKLLNFCSTFCLDWDICLNPKTRPDTRPPVADGWAGAEMRVFTLFDSCSPTDGRTDGRTDKASYRVACPQLKIDSDRATDGQTIPPMQVENKKITASCSGICYLVFIVFLFCFVFLAAGETAGSEATSILSTIEKRYVLNLSSAVLSETRE